MENFINLPTDPEAAELNRYSSKNTPQEAVKVIEDADQLNMHPDTYDDMKGVLEPEVNINKETPPEVDPVLKNYASQSSNHARLVGNETGTLQKVSNKIGFMVYQLIGKREDEADIFKLQNANKNTPEGLSPDGLEQLEYLKEKRNEKVKSFGLSDYEQIPGLAVGVVGDIAQDINKNKTALALAVGAGAGVGGLTPLGPATAGAGALLGGSLATTGILVKEAYRRISVASFDELINMKGDDGKPLNLSRQQADNISTGVGIVSGVLEGVTGATLTFGLTKLLTRGATGAIVKNTALKTALDILGHTLRTAGVSSVEEIASELVERTGQNFAKTYTSDKGSDVAPSVDPILKDYPGLAEALDPTDTKKPKGVVPSEEGLTSAIYETIDNVLTDSEFRKQLLITGAVGALAGGVPAAVTGTVTSPKIKRDLDAQNAAIEKQKVQNEVIETAIEALETQNEIYGLTELANQTELKKMSIKQMSKLKKDMFTSAGYEENIFFSELDMAVIEENNPELAETLRVLNVTESTDTGAPLGIEMHEFSDLVDESPTVAEYARLHPEAPNPLESRNLLDRVAEANKERQAIFQSLGVEGELTPEQIATLENLDKTVEEGTRAAGEKGYIERPTFSENIQDIIPEKQVEDYNKAVNEARISVAEEVNKDFDAREIRIENRIVRANEKIAKELEIKKNKVQLKVVEDFKYDKNFPVPNHKKKGYSQLAIDPKYLPDDLREAYVTDPKLIQRRAFVEGGITLEESAALAGIPSGEEMLNILANAPSQKEILATRKKNSKSLREKVRETREKSVDERRDKAFDNYAKLNLKELKFMKEHEWGNVKVGIKKIALPLPNIESIRNDAKEIIRKTKVGQINPRQYHAGEKALQKKSLNHILRQEPEQAFVSKEKAIFNAELTRESLRVKARLTDAKQFIKKLTSKKGRETIKKGGLSKQVNEILSLFDLVGRKPKGITQDSYLEFLNNLDKEGKSIVVPEQFNDTRQRGNDLTTDQYFRITERLRTLEHQAKQENKLLVRTAKQEKLNEIYTVESKVNSAVEGLKKHPRYNPKRTETVENEESKGLIQKGREGFGIFTALQTNAKNVATELDGELLGGENYENTMQPMVNSETFKRDRTSQVVSHIKIIAKNYGDKRFIAAFNDAIDIPSFAGFQALGNGKMMRSSLWTLQAYLGDPQGRERISNFKNTETKEVMTVEGVQRVLDQHLDNFDVDLVQNFVNIYKTFEEETAGLTERTTGVTPTMVKGVPTTHRGLVRDGGYVPLNYLNTSQTEKLDRFLEVMGDMESSMFGGKTDGKLYSALRAAEQTDQGRLKDRTKSSKPLDTNFMNLLNGYEEHIHDLAYRESGTDVLKLLRNEAYATAIKNTVGEAKYNTMVNAVIETVGKVHLDDTLSPFGEEYRMMNGIYRFFEQNFNIATLGANWTSVAMQPLSVGAATLRMGPTGKRYVAKSLAQISKTLVQEGPAGYKKLFDAAAAINPDLLTNMDSIDDTMIKSTYDFVAKSQMTKHSQGLALLRRGHQWLGDTSMLGLRKLDIHIKMMITLASTGQFLDGNAEAYSVSRLEKMSDTEIQTALKKYTKQVADLALTTSATIDKSAAEKMGMMRVFSRFYTDIRSQRATLLSEKRKIENASIETAKSIRKGEFSNAASHAVKGGISVGSILMVTSMMRMYEDTIRGEENPITELSKVTSMEDFKNYMLNTASYVATSPIDTFTGSTLIAKDIYYAAKSFSRKKKVSIPITKMFSEMTMSITGLIDLIRGDGMSEQELKSTLYSAGYLFRIPVNGPRKIKEIIDESETYGDVKDFIRGLTYELSDEIGKFKARHKDNPEKQGMIEGLEEIQKKVVPALEQQINNIIPEDAMEVLKTGEWDERNPTTGASGIYQFTEEAWDEISEQNPDLGLTDNGRLSKDSREQEKAINWEMDRNAKVLVSYDIDVDNSTLFGAHRFGLADFVAVMLSNNNEKLSGIVENKLLFEGFKTVGQVKKYTKSQVDQEK